MNEGDFVRYLGDHTSLDPLRRNEAIAIIVSMVESLDGWRALLKIIGSGELSCPVSFLRPISTENVHLRRLGFEEISIDGKKKYVMKNGLVISGFGGGITLGNRTSYFATGYCLGDLTNISNTEMQNYINHEGFDKKAFNVVYTDLNNVNSLFKVLEDRGAQFDKLGIIGKL